MTSTKKENNNNSNINVFQCGHFQGVMYSQFLINIYENKNLTS